MDILAFNWRVNVDLINFILGVGMLLVIIDFFFWDEEIN